MFFRQITDFEDNFKFLDRLNAIVFNVWRDNNAESFKTQSMEQLQMFYRNYINEMRQKGNQMKALLQEINELQEQIRQIGQETQRIALDPEIHGCSLWYADGKISDDMSGSKAFIMLPSDPRDPEEEIIKIAISRCKEIRNIEKVHMEGPL